MKNKVPSYAKLDPIRRGVGPIPGHVIDEFVGGRLSRRDFIRRGTLVGLGLPTISAILVACSNSTNGQTNTTSGQPAPRAGATIRAGTPIPGESVNPITSNTTGAEQMMAQVAEWLVFVNQENVYQPWLATSWSPNADATSWTFKIRDGVKFNDGRILTADDVVYSVKSQCDPKSGANALSIFGGTLVPEGVEKIDDSTVVFNLEQADGAFVDAMSQDNINMLIVPNNYDFGHFNSDFIGTGRFVNTSYSAEGGATFARNPHYWGTPALPAKLEYTFFSNEEAIATALQAGDIDTFAGLSFSVATSPQLLNGNFNIIALRQSTHRECSMRNDIPPFNNKYVRQAIALTLDRPTIARSLFKGYAQVGNDSPFAPVFRATVEPPAVPQRVQNLRLAKELLAKGGVGRGFATQLRTDTTAEMPLFAQIIATSAKKIGVDIGLTVETQTKYFGQSTFGSSDWLDSTMSLVDYSSRAAPNVFLEAPLQTITKSGSGTWNAARFNNATYDRLSKEFVASPDLSTQRRLAKQIELLLLEETPIIYAYFYDYLCATLKNVYGVYPTGTAVFLNMAYKTT